MRWPSCFLSCLLTSPLRFLLPALLVILTPYLAQAEDAAAETPLLTRIQHVAEDISTITLHFEQDKDITLFDERITTPGVIMIDRRNGCLRWEFTDHATFIFAKGHVRKWDAQGHEDTGLDRDPNITSLKAQMEALITGDWATAQELFTITATDTTLHLRPKDPALARFIATIDITFSADLRAPQRLELNATGGDTTTYRFAEAVCNNDFPASTWEPPAPHAQP